MSVLLQGLSTPKGNPRTINIYRDGVWCDAYTTENGKAIEVPTPHGRLIDAKALTKDLGNRWNVNDDQDFCNKEVLHGIEEAPTIIPAEEGE